MKGARFIRCKKGSYEPVKRCRFIPIYNRVNLEPEPEPTKNCEPSVFNDVAAGVYATTFKRSPKPDPMQAVVPMTGTKPYMKINELMKDSNTKVTQVTKHAKTAGDKPLRIGTGLPGPGRPKKAMEQLVRHLGQAALKKKYGSLDKAFIALLESKEPSLIRLVFEYALGKPADINQAPGGIPFNQLTIQVVQANNNNGSTEHTNNQGISDTTGK